jgi:hypothetical protein
MSDNMQIGFQEFGAFSKSREQRIQKALTYAGTSGALTLEAIDREIEHLVNYKNVLRMNIPRIPGESDAYKIVQRTAGSTPGEFLAETGDFTEDNGSYAKVSFQYRTLGGRGKIGRLAQRMGQSFVNVLSEEMAGKLEDFADFEEAKIVYGTTATSNEFCGIHKLVCNTAGQVVGCTTGSTGVALTIAKLDEVWDQTRRFPDAALLSFKTRRAINALLQKYQTFVNTIEVKGGFIVNSYNNTPLLPSSNIKDVLAWNGTTVSGLTGGLSSEIITVCWDKFFISELTPLTFMMLARVSSQYDQFDLFEDIVPVLKNAYDAAILSGFDPRL